MSDWQRFQAWIPARARVALDESPVELRPLRESALYYHWLSIRNEPGINQRQLFDDNLPDWDWLRPKAKNRRRRRNADDELRRLERAAAQGDQEAEARLWHTRRRAGVEFVTPHSHRLVMHPERSAEETAFLLGAIEELAWSRIENWEEDRVPIRALGDARTQLAFLAHIFDREWRWDERQIGEDLSDLFYDYDGLPHEEGSPAPLSKAEAIALLENLVPCLERRALLAGAWARLDADAKLRFRDIFSDDLIRELDNGIQCVSQNPRRRH